MEEYRIKYFEPIEINEQLESKIDWQSIPDYFHFFLRNLNKFEKYQSQIKPRPLFLPISVIQMLP